MVYQAAKHRVEPRHDSVESEQPVNVAHIFSAQCSVLGRENVVDIFTVHAHSGGYLYEVLRTFELVHDGGDLRLIHSDSAARS